MKLILFLKYVNRKTGQIRFYQILKEHVVETVLENWRRKNFPQPVLSKLNK